MSPPIVQTRPQNIFQKYRLGRVLEAWERIPVFARRRVGSRYFFSKLRTKLCDDETPDWTKIEKKIFSGKKVIEFLKSVNFGAWSKGAVSIFIFEILILFSDTFCRLESKISKT